MRVLALDSAMNGCSACVFHNKTGVISDKHLNIARGQAEHLMPLINEVMEKASAEYDDLDLIAVTHGPGAFTGMRIGIATAKTIGLVTGKPVAGVCCFQAVLESYFLENEEAGTKDYYAVILETKRKDYYFQMFEGKTKDRFGEAMVVGAKDILSIVGEKKCVFIGDALLRLEEESGKTIDGHHINLPKPQAVAQLALRRYEVEKERINCDPVYLRPPEIGTPKRPMRSIK